MRRQSQSLNAEEVESEAQRIQLITQTDYAEEGRDLVTEATRKYGGSVWDKSKNRENPFNSTQGLTTLKSKHI